MYSPVSPQVGHETSVSKQVNWNTWAVIQDCSIPSATQSAAPIISIFFIFFFREAPHHFQFTQHVFTVIHPHFLLSFRYKSTVSWVRLFCFRGISGIDGNTQFREKSVTLGNICRNTSWIDWAGQICWQIINKTEIKCSALWEGWVQPSVAGVLVLISDWSISESNDVMLVTTPYKEISVENQGSETAGIYLWSVSAIMTWNLETSVSKQVNWNTWAVIQDCSIPSATRSAAPIISIFFREAPHHFRFTQRVFTIIHPHFLLSFRRST